MITSFKDLEGPFIEGTHPARKNRPGRQQEREREWEREKEGFKGRLSNGRAEKGAFAVDDDYFMDDYGASTFRQRWLWLYRRRKFADLSQRLTSVQTRRIARQTSDLAV